MKNITIAAVTFNSIIGKTDYNLERIEKWTIKAKQNRADIICFPELNITGYTSGRDIINAAVSLPGRISDRIADIASTHQIAILAGAAQKGEKGLVYAAHLFVKPDGALDIYRKLHIAPAEQKYFIPGTDIRLFDIHGIKFGIQLCYDAHFPELATAMALKGADIIFIPHASPRGTPDEKYRSWMRHLPARAYDNSVFIVACNMTGKNGLGLSFPGISIIMDPSGRIINSDTSGKENIIIADLKAEAIARVRNHRMRYFLPGRRPELYNDQT